MNFLTTLAAQRPFPRKKTTFILTLRRLFLRRTGSSISRDLCWCRLEDMVIRLRGSVQQTPVRALRAAAVVVNQNLPPRKDVKTLRIIVLRPHRLLPEFWISNVVEFGTTNKGLLNICGVLTLVQGCSTNPWSPRLLISCFECETCRASIELSWRQPNDSFIYHDLLSLPHMRE